MRLLDHISRAMRENIVDSLKLFCYGEVQTQTNQKEQRRWQREKDRRSLAVRAKAAAREPRRVAPGEAGRQERSRRRRQQRKPARRLAGKLESKPERKAARAARAGLVKKLQRVRRKQERNQPVRVAERVRRRARRRELPGPFQHRNSQPRWKVKVLLRNRQVVLAAKATAAAQTPPASAKNKCCWSGRDHRTPWSSVAGPPLRNTVL